MKSLTIIVLYCLGFVYPLSAQHKIKTEESHQNIGGGRNNAVVVTIYDLDESSVEKGWKNELKNFNPEKTGTKSGEIFADNASLGSVSGNVFDIYARAEKSGENEVKFIVAFDLGGAFLSSAQHGGSFRTAEKMVYDFAVKMTLQGVAEKLKLAKKELEKRNRKLEQLVKDKERLNQDIEKYKTQIMQAEGNIVRAQEEIKENEKMQEDAKYQIGEQEKAVKEIEDQEKKVE
ncbi:MAG: hypothetical protein HYY40_09255 [Bacteroidetes bacterium]|nr:hypothetical protein [Bacteroidota bacterium]